MSKTFALLLFFIHFTSAAQLIAPRFQWEAYLAVALAHHHQCELENKALHQEINSGFGIRINYNFNRKCSFVAGFAFDHFIGQHQLTPTSQLLHAAIKYNWSFNKKHPNILMTAETGIEYYVKSNQFHLPVYLGMHYLMVGNIDLIVRVKTPRFYFIGDNKEFQLVDNRIEIGLALNPKWYDLPKFQHYNGNPFILNYF